MPVSETKRRNNDKYNAKCTQINIKPLTPEADKIKAAASDAGQSLQGFILQAVREKMESVTASEEEGRVKISVNASALEKHQQPGESAAECAVRILKESLK